MPETTRRLEALAAGPHPGPVAAASPPRWRPELEVICLACEISAYAPDDGEPIL